MKRFLLKALLSLVAIMSWQLGNAQDFSGERGYVDFGNLTGIYGEPTIQINLGKTMLNFVSAAAQNEEPEVAELFKNLKSVRVLVYNIVGSTNDALNTVDRVTNDMRNEGWESIVSVNKEKEKVRIYARMTADIIDGLVVMAVDEDGIDDDKDAGPQAVFINVIGQIDPAQVGRLTSSLDIDVDVTP